MGPGLNGLAASLLWCDRGVPILGEGIIDVCGEC